MLETMTLETFEPLIGEKFKVRVSESEFDDFELIDVEELPVGRRRRNAPALLRKPFSIFFVARTLLPQAMYPFEHAALGDGPVEIFIVPVAKTEAGIEYEAVFT